MQKESKEIWENQCDANIKQRLADMRESKQLDTKINKENQKSVAEKKTIPL